MLKVGYLKQKQALPLEAKILLSKRKIKEWLDWMYDNYPEYSPCISFSGGKDSTVLLDLVRQVDPTIVAIFSDTGLEYPEIRDFVKTVSNVVWVKPEKNFKQVIEEYGYPIISKLTARKLEDLKNQTDKNKNVCNLYLTGIKKDGTKGHTNFKLAKKWRYLIDAPFKISPKCCLYIKKQAMFKYQKKNKMFPFIGTLAEESKNREQSYNITGCNAYNSQEKKSAPISFWTEQDILEYIVKYKLPYARGIYGEIKKNIADKYYCTKEKRTGCMFCMFGVHLEKGINRFQRMSKTHPKQYKYCMEQLKIKEILEYIGVNHELPKRIKIKTYKDKK